jgi:hypothetical protein
LTRPLAFLAAVLILAGLAAPRPAAAKAWNDFALGANAESQPCRAVWRFETANSPTAVDIYCGAWESPSGTLRVAAAGSDAAAMLARTCAGDATPVAGDAGLQVMQVACRRAAGDEGPARYGIIAQAGGRTAYGAVFPADWSPLVNAARVTLGLDQPGAALASATAQTPGLREIQSVYPDGPPGQGAAFNYELLRRRGYEQNIAWSFGASERDFSELLRAHQRVAPEDKAGEAEIFAEIAMNLSDGRRFQDAGELLDRAEAQAREAGDILLLSKIANYRAIDQLNQGHNAEALKLALAANADRAHLETAPPMTTTGTVITPAASRTLENRTAPRTSRALLAMLEDLTPQERAQVLSAQGSAIAATATRALGGPSAWPPVAKFGAAGVAGGTDL